MRKSLNVLLSNRPNDVELLDLFSLGNTKLGEQIITFSLPPIDTCNKGSSSLCRKVCYADRGSFKYSSVMERYNQNLAVTTKNDFVDYVINTLRNSSAKTVRWHVAGDFYNLDYLLKVYQIFLYLPEVKFYLYTRTWREPTFTETLEQMSKLNNVSLWLSCDRETGVPGRLGKSRIAYMQVENDDIPDKYVHLIFRDVKLRKTVVKRINGYLVCPVENGITDTSCEKCRICVERQ